MSKGVINSITLDKTVILKDESAKVTVDYTASGSGVFTLDDFKLNDINEGLNIAGVFHNKLTHHEQTENDYFGGSVAISGDYAIIGAHQSENSYLAEVHHGAGAAYIFKKEVNGTGAETWSARQILTASDGLANDNFGFSVAISGNYAIVGAYKHDSNKGAAYIFKMSGQFWRQQKKLMVDPAEPNDYFGYSVAISGDYAIVGAFGTEVMNSNFQTFNNMGAAYIFSKDQGSDDNWGQQAKLAPSDGEFNNFFGYSVAISGNYAIVGAHFNNESSRNVGGATGNAYIFKKKYDDEAVEYWTIQKKIWGSNTTSNDRFGYSVAISGDYAIVGCGNARYVHYGGTAGGATSVYIFYKDKDGDDEWGQQQRLIANDDSKNWFGHSVAISGDYAIVGKQVLSGGEGFCAYLFKRYGSTWTQQKKLIAADNGTNNYYFGYFVAIDGDYTLIGTNTGVNSEITFATMANAKNNIFDPPHDETPGYGSAWIYNQQYSNNFSLSMSKNWDISGVVYFNNLKINTSNWSGITESEYFLINNYSNQGHNILNTVYNDFFLNIVNSYSSVYENGYTYGYTIGSGSGYIQGELEAEREGFGSGSGYIHGYAEGSGVGYTTGYATGYGTGYTNGYNDNKAEDTQSNTNNVVVHPGWNIFSPAKSGSINDTDNIIIDHTLQYFNGTSYEQTNKNNIEEGKGYMVKCAGSGSFTINYS